MVKSISMIQSIISSNSSFLQLKHTLIQAYKVLIISYAKREVGTILQTFNNVLNYRASSFTSQVSSISTISIRNLSSTMMRKSISIVQILEGSHIDPSMRIKKHTLSAYNSGRLRFLISVW